MQPIFPTGVSNAAFGAEWSGELNGTAVSSNSAAIVQLGTNSPPDTFDYTGMCWAQSNGTNPAYAGY
jgi:hypothetical protein